MSSNKVVKSWTTKAGLKAAVVLVNDGSHHCGYVEAPEALKGKDYSEIEDSIDVHGGVTYSGNCYFLETSNPDYNTWVFGYDCAHLNDRTAYWKDGVWRDEEYCTQECETLAEQLLKLCALPKPL